MTTQGSTHNQESPSSQDGGSRGVPPRPGRPLLHDLIELIELEVQLVALRCARVARDALVRLCILGAAVAALIIGIVFLYISIFRILEHFLLIWQICLIFAAVHLIAGGAILLMGDKRAAPPTPPGERHVD